MKRLWISLLIIALLACASLINVQYLDRFTTDLSDTLRSAQALAECGQPESAFEKTRQAQQTFLRHSFYLHITLDHQDIDGIQSAFGEALEYLRLGEIGGVYVSANSNLLIKLGLLTEAEQLTLKNIL